MKLEKINYGGWPNCYRLSNNAVDLIVTTDVGPRIIRFGFIGEANEFGEFTDMLGKTGGNEWRIYGGHRLWHSPEVKPRTYYADNFPLTLEEHTDFIRLIQPIEATTGIQKEIDITLSPDSAHVRLIHRLRNHNLWAVELAPWALTVMARGGVAIVPLPRRGEHATHLLPSNTLVLWAYTDLSDPRWLWRREFILLCQDSQITSPQKLGLLCLDGWLAYARQGHLFLKTFPYHFGATYSDLGCSAEVFTNAEMLELESLGPLTKLATGEALEHVEEWWLTRGIKTALDDAELERIRELAEERRRVESGTK
jgi:hypothetical protein